MKRLMAVAVLVLFLLSTGCTMYTSRFSPPMEQMSTVILKENDFKYVERDLEGTYSYWGLALGAFPVLALEIPLGDPRIYSSALAQMYRKSGPKAQGKPTQMINWALDQNDWFLPIPYVTVFKRTATFRADLIEYTK